MPLVVTCGIPASGKTTVSRKLWDALAERGTKVHLINEETLHINKVDGYSSPEEEKLTRAMFKAEVERVLSTSVVVICDSVCTYNRGFRYELNCLAKALPTTSCTVFCDTPLEVATKWNAERASDNTPTPLHTETTPSTTPVTPTPTAIQPTPFPQPILESLAQKLEVPQDTTRFDRPVFTILPQDTETTTSDTITAICDALLCGRAPRPNASTAQHKCETSGNAHMADRATLDVVDAIVRAVASPTFTPGDSLRFDCVGGSSETSGTSVSTCTLVIRRRVSLAELRRVRGEFMRLVMPHLSSVQDVKTAFVKFLDSSWSS
ncbi:KTI12 protein [Pelomyxa schiedti]|nr:KTI12 protein [Pelomyxa schiedti]